MTRQDKFLKIFSLVVFSCTNLCCFSQKQKGGDELYLVQLKAAEAYFRLNQVGEAKSLLQSVPEKSRSYEWQLLNARMDRAVQTLTDHSRPVVGVAVSSNGKYLATGSADNSIIIRDANTYKVTRKIEVHKGQVTTLDFSADGKSLISGSTDRSLRLWNIDDGKEIRNYNEEFKQGIYQVKFSSDGKMLAAASWELVTINGSRSVQGFAKIIDVETGKLIQRFDTDNHPASAVKFGNNDKKLYTGTWGFQIKQHDIASGQTGWNFDMREYDYYTAVQSIDLSPDAKYVVQGGKDNKIRLLSVTDGKQVYCIEPSQGHREWVNGVRFSPDGKHFASVSDDGLLKVWETATARTIHTFKGHTAGMNQLAWHPDGKRIFTTANDNTIKVWDIEKPGEMNFKASKVGPWYAPVSSDGDLIAPVNSDKHFALYDLNSGKQQIFLDSLTAFSAVFTTNGEFVAAGSRQLNIYDTKTGKRKMTGRGHTAMIYGMDYSQNLNLFATAGDKTIRLWNVKDTAAFKTISTASGAYAVKFSPDGKKIYAGCTDGKVKVISTSSWQVTDSLQSGTTIFNMAVSADGKYMATAGNAEAVAWNLGSKKSIPLKGHTKWVYGVAFHPSLPVAVTASYDRTVRFWDVEKGVNTLTLFGFEKELYTVSLTHNGNRIVITDTDGTVFVFDL